MKKSTKCLLRGIMYLAISILGLTLTLIYAKINRLNMILMWFHGGISITAGFAEMALYAYYKSEENKNGN